MKQKTILFIGWLFYPRTGGAETIMLNQARELVKRGYLVAVLTSVLDDGGDQDLEIFGIKVFRRSFVNCRITQDDRVVAEGIREVIEMIKPDIIHFHNGSYPSGTRDRSVGVKTVLAMYEAIRPLKIPIIEHAHNAQLRDAEITKPLRAIPWDFLICVSDFVQKEWQKLGTQAKNSRVVYNGIDIKHFATAGQNNFMAEQKRGGRVVLFSPARLFSLTTGELNKQKNLQLVFDALGILVEKGVTGFCLVSITNEVSDPLAVITAQEKIEKMLDNKNLTDKVTFIPTIDPDDMPEYYAGADIVCVPALYETFGLMYLEAMAAGKVVIASNTGGPMEYIENNKNGFLVEPNDAEALAILLEKLILDKDFRSQIGAQAINMAKKYSVEMMVDGIVEIYKELIRD